jgi:hypothetical protein
LAREILESYEAGLLSVILFAAANNSFEPLVWVAANMHSFVCLFITLSTLFLIYYFKYEKKKSISLSFSFIFAVLSLGTKEVAIILFPIILAIAVYFIFILKQKIRTDFIFYSLANILLFGIYAYYQYLWQSSSVWVENRVWEISAPRLLKIPLSFLSAALPVQFILNEKRAISLFVLSVILIIILLFKFRKKIGVWFGFYWAILAALPVTFFQTEHWWNLLSSRYTYTIRVGIVLILATIFVHWRQKAQTGALIFFNGSISRSKIASSAWFCSKTCLTTKQISSS